MNSRHLIDPDLLGLLEKWPQVTLDESLLPLLRDATRLPVGEIAHPERTIKATMTAPGRDGAPDVPLTSYRPANRQGASLPCLYHMHGGGYVGGSAATLEPIHRLLVETLDCMLVSVDYRLAPETPFPGPLEDCYAGLDWLVRHADEWGVDAGRIGIGGESAGGGLAAALALLARNRGEHRLAFQHLVYPMIDDRTCITTDPHPHAGEFVWNAASNAFGWRAYLGRAPGADDIPAYAAAARSSDLAGLPPTFLCTGALDLFVDEDIRYGSRLIRAGVPTELHVYPGGFHGFDIDQTAEVSRRLRRDSWAFLKRHLHADDRRG
jgi:acetyl esterase/lipase